MNENYRDYLRDIEITNNPKKLSKWNKNDLAITQ